jgi:hypothetical protein
VVYWQSLDAIAHDVVADYVLLAQDGSIVRLAQSALLGGTAYPTHLWRPAEIVADYLSLRIPPNVPGGTHRLGVRLRGEHGETLAELPLAEVTVNTWERRFELPADVTPLAWQLGESIHLVGARLPQTVSRDDELPVTLYWRAEQTVFSDYVAFVHLIDEAGRLVGQDDSVPGQGKRPAPGWLKGEIVEDYHALPVPANLAPGTYRVLVGLYDANSGERLRSGTSDAVTLTSLELP